MSETNENVTGEVLPANENDAQAAPLDDVAAAEVEEVAEEIQAAVDEAAPVEEEKPGEETPAQDSETEDEPADEQEEAFPVKKSGDISHLVIVGIISLVLGILLCLPYFLKGADASDHDLSEGVAVTVNGVAIGEKEITDYVAGLRDTQGLSEDAAWAEWMGANGYTPETVRNAVIEYFVMRELQDQAVAENDITVSDEAVEEQVNMLVEQFGSQEALEEALADQGADFDAYRDNIRRSLQQQELAKKVAQDVEPASDEQILEILKAYYPDAVDKDASSLDGLDEDLVASIREALQSSAVEQAYSMWMQDYQAQATVDISEMPEGLSYDVDMSASEQDASEDAEGK